MAHNSIIINKYERNAILFFVDACVLLLSLCGYIALYSYSVMHGFHIPTLITFISTAFLSHLLPFIGGALFTLFISEIIIKYLLNPLVRQQYTVLKITHFLENNALTDLAPVAFVTLLENQAVWHYLFKLAPEVEKRVMPPVIMTLLQLTIQGEKAAIRKRARALVIRSDTMRHLHHKLANWEKDQRTALWNACIKIATKRITTCFKSTYFEKDNSHESMEKAARFLTHLIQLMPKDQHSANAVVTPLLNCLVEQLKTIGKKHLTLLLIETFIMQLDTQNNCKYFSQAAEKWQQETETLFLDTLPSNKEENALWNITIWYRQIYYKLNNGKFTYSQITFFLKKGGLARLPAPYFSFMLRHEAVWKCLSKLEIEVKKKLLPAALVRDRLLHCTHSQRMYFLKRCFEKQAKENRLEYGLPDELLESYLLGEDGLYSQLAKEKVYYFLRAWEITQPYWQDKAKKTNIESHGGAPLLSDFQPYTMQAIRRSIKVIHDIKKRRHLMAALNKKNASQVLEIEQKQEKEQQTAKSALPEPEKTPCLGLDGMSPKLRKCSLHLHD